MSVRLFVSALALVAVLLPAAHAQATFKVAYVETDQVVVRMPDFAQVQQQLQGEQQQVGQRVRFVQDSLGTVLRTRVEAYEAFNTSALATDVSRRERQTEIVQLQGNIERAEQEGLQYLSFREAQLLQPVLNRVDLAIQAEAGAQQIDLVLPTTANNAPAFLYASDRVTDITPQVMRRLGIDPNAPAPNGARPTVQPATGN